MNHVNFLDSLTVSDPYFRMKIKESAFPCCRSALARTEKLSSLLGVGEITVGILPPVLGPLRRLISI